MLIQKQENMNMIRSNNQGYENKYISYKSFLIGMFSILISIFVIGGGIATNLFYSKVDGARVEERLKAIDNNLNEVLLILKKGHK